MYFKMSILLWFFAASIISLYFSAADGYVDNSNNGNVVFRTDDCQTTNWSEWSECPVTCGTGFMTRSRYLYRPYRKIYCTHISLIEKKKCINPPCATTLVDQNCATTEWSSWSVCSASCGKGIQTRVRYLTTSKHLWAICKNKIALEDSRECTNTEGCATNNRNTIENCLLDRDTGVCRGSFDRWYFDKNTKQCTEFIYGGCDGNENNFWTKDQCIKACSTLLTT